MRAGPRIPVRRPRARPGLFRRFAADRRGVSAVEFALIAPVMIVFYFGLSEFCQGYMAQKRMSHSAAAVADLVAQTDVVTTDEMADILAIGQTVMKPFPTSGLTLRVSSVTRGADGVAKVDWSRSSSGAGLTKNAIVTAPLDVVANDESIVMAEATYVYSSAVKYLLKDGVKFTSTFYSRPRRVDKVGCSDC